MEPPPTASVSGPRVLGLDVGGANLKISDGRRFAATMPFALWKDPAGLATQLKRALAAAPSAELLAVAMTGELCDCFETKSAGVAAILAAVEDAAAGRPTAVYLTTGAWATPATARTKPWLAAASNWCATALWIARWIAPNRGVLIDVGSTTTDIIPLEDGEVAARGANDLQRLAVAELVYQGVERTPVCAVVRSLPWRGRAVSVAAELFATTGDAHRWLGNLPDEPANFDTVDGRPRTRRASRGRLARMICLDDAELKDDDAGELAAAVAREQAEAIATAVRQLTPAHRRDARYVLAGQGEFLARQALHAAGVECEPISLTAALGPAASQAAAAYALAVLAANGLTDGIPE